MVKFDSDMRTRYINTIVKYRKILPVGFDLNVLEKWDHIAMYLDQTYKIEKIYTNIDNDITVY